MEDPMKGALAFDTNEENFDILQNMIKDKVGATDDNIRTPYPKFNKQFVTRNSVDTEHEIYVPIDANSEGDFDQEDYLAYGLSDPTLKHY